ncbi:MAG: hypothetical protein M1419_05625 [Bacteroidetes bacterium]|nr:hypothetical protein [Bacteroidota bacterium]
MITNRNYQDTIKPFKYKDRGSLATIGKAKAIALFGKMKFSGFFAWILWPILHI